METLDITSGDIAAAVKAATPVPASPAETPLTPTDPAPAAAIVQPVAPEKKDDPAPLPFERHHAILASTREDYERKLADLEWARRLDPKAVSRAIEMADRYEKAEADRAKSTAAPQPDMKTEDGTLIYSAPQAAALARFEAQQAVEALRKEFSDRVTPFESEHAERQRMNGLVSQIQEAATWPGFNDHIDLVNLAIKDANAKGLGLSLHDAYIKVVVPKLAAVTAEKETALKKQWLEELNATTDKTTHEVNPSRTPASSRKKDSEMSISELFADETAKRKTG